MWFWWFTLVISTALATPKVSYPAQEISLKNVKEIQIIGVRGSLRMIRKEGPRFKNKLRMAVKHTRGKKSDDWYLSVERRGHTLFLEVFSTAYGKEWRKQVRQEKWPEFDVSLEGEARATTVSWREGDLLFDGWNQNLDISFLKGQAQIQNGEGEVKLQAVRADVSVSEQKGKLTLKGESGRIVMTNVHADVRVNWISGDLRFSRCRGEFVIESPDSKLVAESIAGAWTVNMPKGTASLLGVEGKLKAAGRETQWSVGPAAGSDISVVSESGNVRISGRPGRTKVFLTSRDGKIRGPVGLNSKTDGYLKVVEGVDTAAGGGTMGQLFVKTQSGDIGLQ